MGEVNQTRQEPRHGRLATGLAKPGLLVGAVLAVAGLALVLTLTVVQAEDSLDTGVGSPTACKNANVTGTIDGGGGDEVTVQAGAGNVVNMICIKTGQAIFPLLGDGDCANVATDTTKSSHSQCITADGQYANGPCYMVSGIGTAKVTVTRKPASCPGGSGISHVDFLAKPKTVGGISADGELRALPLETASSSGPNAGLLAGVAAALIASTVALGSAAWYTRRRWLR